MNPKKFKKIVKEILEDWNAFTPDEIKKLFAEQVEIESQEMAVKNPAPNFSSWPPEMPERPCPWRLEEELQKYRLRVPEPAECEWEVVYYPLDIEPIWSALFSGETPGFEPMKNSKFRKILVRYGRNSFHAWSADGETPIFPIPMEGEL